jgi:H/ACA ribonucleoprotein complex non-core subunit NAF1
MSGIPPAAADYRHMGQTFALSIVGGSSVTSTFKTPNHPSLPQDLSLIADMVNSQQVVGSLPVLDISVAEKRRLVEQSLRAGKGKAKAVSGDTQVEDASSSSSEEESSDEEESEPEAIGKSLSAEEHTIAKLEIDKIMGMTGAEVDSNSEPESSDLSSEEDDEEDVVGEEGITSTSPLPSPRAPKRARDIAFEMLDEEEMVSSEPITSTNEVAVVPVALPPLDRLPEGEGTQLAGEVISWIREKKVEAWLEREAAKEAEHGSPVQTEEIESSSVVLLEGVKASDGGGSQDMAPTRTTLYSIAQAEVPIPNSGLVPEDDEENEVQEMLVGEGAPEPTLSGHSDQPSVEIQSDGVGEENGTNHAGHHNVSRLPGDSVHLPKFATAGTVVVRAMQSRPGSGEDGWLEDGSVLCHEDGRVLGIVSFSSRSTFCTAFLIFLIGRRNLGTSHLTLLHPATPSPTVPIPPARFANSWNSHILPHKPPI